MQMKVPEPAAAESSAQPTAEAERGEETQLDDD